MSLFLTYKFINYFFFLLFALFQFQHNIYFIPLLTKAVLLYVNQPDRNFFYVNLRKTDEYTDGIHKTKLFFCQMICISVQPFLRFTKLWHRVLSGRQETWFFFSLLQLNNTQRSRPSLWLDSEGRSSALLRSSLCHPILSSFQHSWTETLWIDSLCSFSLSGSEPCCIGDCKRLIIASQIQIYSW